MKRSCALTQMTHVHRTAGIRLEKASQPVHDASAASFVHACYNALNQAITLFLLVRQQLERIDHVVTQPQKRCVRFEDLRFIGIDTESSLFTFADPLSAQVLIIILLLPKAEHLKHRLLTPHRDATSQPCLFVFSYSLCGNLSSLSHACCRVPQSLTAHLPSASKRRVVTSPECA